MENDDDHHQSLSSPRESENACQVTDESPEGRFFMIGKRLLFSTSSISLSAEELKHLEEEVNELDEEDENQEEAEAKVATVEPTSAPDAEPRTSEKPGSPWHGFIHKLKQGPTMNFHAFQSSMPHLRSLKILSRKRFTREAPSLPELPPNLDAELYDCFQNSWINFSLSELQEATNNFSKENVIGEGGYSKVYKGHLENGQLVAVKRLNRGTTDEMTADYLSELGILVHVSHPNVANVIGYGVEGGMHIILPLSVHGSLSSLLTGAKEKLTWNLRYNIALGIASGLSYLHEGCQRRIIHRDIKSANILLTEDFEPMISDFGLAKWLPDQWTHLTASQFQGTLGYLPPEFFMFGIIDEKTDVYAYGVLLLEIISGRPAIDDSHNSLVIWATPLLNAKNTVRIVDPSLGGVYDLEQLDHMAKVASMCLHQDPAERPQMTQALRMLKGDEGSNARKFQKRPALKRPHFDLIAEFKCRSPPNPSDDGRILKSDTMFDQEILHQDIGMPETSLQQTT